MDLIPALPARFGEGDPNLWRKILDVSGDFAVNLCIAAIILVATFWAARWASGLVRRMLGRFQRTRSDATLQSFGASLVRYAVLIVGFIAVLTRLGVATTSVIAVLGAASLAVGLALQGTLSNVAAGVMLLLFRPYRVGDFVEIAGKQGVVRSLDLFTTEISTLDNVQVTAPNSKIFGDFIVNFSAHPTRRVDLILHVDFTVDLRDALARLRTVADGDPRILTDPPPLTEVVGLFDNWADVALRVWVNGPDFGPVKSDLLAAVKHAFDEAGYPTPYPHQVQVIRESEAPA
jgi:small conductance mechanosensitive channel